MGLSAIIVVGVRSNSRAFYLKESPLWERQRDKTG